VLETVAGLHVPTLVILGTSDSLVPPAQSQAVADASGGPVEVLRIEGADHNDPELLDGTPMTDSVVDLARRVGCLPPG